MITRLLEKLFEHWADNLYRHRVLYLVSTLLLTAVSFHFTRQLQLDASFQSLLPADHPINGQLDRIAKIYGGVGNVIAVMRADKPEPIIRFMEKFSEALAPEKEIRYTDFQKTHAFFEKNLLLYLSEDDLSRIHDRLKRKFDYERKKNNPLLMDLGEDRDPGLPYKDIVEPYRKQYDPEGRQVHSRYFYRAPGKEGKEHVFVMFIKPAHSSLNLSYSEKITRRIAEVAESLKPRSFDPSLKVEFTGRYVKKPATLAMLGRDFRMTTWISAAGVLLVLILFFRSALPVALLFSVLLAGIFWTLGCADLIFGKLNLITSFLVAVLTGLGIDFGIHYLIRYGEEKDSGKTPEQAFKTVIAQSGQASFVSGFTTAAGFSALSLSGFRAFQEFGIIAAMGVMCTYFSMTILLNCTVSLLDRNGKFRLKKSPVKIRPPRLLVRHAFKVAAVFIVLFVVSLAASAWLRFDYDFSRLTKYPNMRPDQLDEEVDAMFRGSMTPSVIIPKDAENEKNILHAIRDYVEKYPDKKRLRLEKGLGITSFVPENQDEKMAQIRKIRRLIDQNRKYMALLEEGLPENLRRIQKLLEVKPFSAVDLPHQVTKNFHSRDSKQSVVLLFPRANLDNGREILELAEQLNQIKVNGVPLEVASDSLVFAEILNDIREDGSGILFLAAGLVFIIVWWNFGSWKQALFVCLPVAGGLILLLGALAVFRLPLSFINVLVFPMMVGIGIDNGVHIFHRYLQEKNVEGALQHTIEAVSLATLTTFWAFFSLTFASNRAISAFGAVNSIAIAGLFLCSCVLMPVFLKLRENKSSSGG